MPFRNEIAGGNGQLVRNWLQSVNYVAGVSGWRISKNGNAEFNNGTFRGSIEVGSLTGQHFIVNNPATGDVIDIYNSANKLVFSIDSTGRLVAASSLSTAEVVINGANLLFEDTAITPSANMFVNGSLSADNMFLNIFGGRPTNYAGTGQGAFISLNTGDTNASEIISVEQRGLQGTLVQNSDSSNTSLNITYTDMLSCTTNVNGDAIVNHTAGFTPVAATGTAAPTAYTQQGVTVMVWQDKFTATQFQCRILNANNTPFVGTMNVMFTFWGKG